LPLIDGLTNFESQIQAQSLDRNFAIGMLAATFARLTSRSGRLMRNDNRRFDFVPMLSARSSPPSPFDFAVLQQFFNRNSRGMH
jgi:hypothetical protein